MLAVLLLTAACQATVDPATPPAIETLDDFTAALSRAGVTYAQLSTQPEPVFGVPGTLIQVGDAQVQVFAFESDTARRTVSETIAPDGYRVAGRALDWDARPNIWSVGRLLVVYPGVDGGTVLLLDGLLGERLTTDPRPPDEPFPPAILAALGHLADQVRVEPELLQVISYAQHEWSDACLGLAEPDELCAAQITPGWQVELEYAGQRFLLRTDEVGTQVRLEGESDR